MTACKYSGSCRNAHSDKLYLSPPSQNPVSTPIQTMYFLHSRKQPRTLSGFTIEFNLAFVFKFP